MAKDELCPKCFGSKQVMEPKESKGFEYKDCTLCNGEGTVSSDVSEDFIFSINEDNFEEEE